MKTNLPFLYTLLISGFIGWLSAGCQPGKNETTPQSTCRIQQSTATEKSRYFNTVNQTTYTYDPAGNLIKSIATLDRRPTTGTFGTQTGTTTVTYAYDSDGYLTASDSQQQTTDSGLNNKSTTEQLSSTNSYSYTSGRLARKSESHTGTYSSSNSNSISVYDYDATGNLTKVTTGILGNNSYQQIWLYSNNQLTDYIEKYGTSEKHPFTIQDGVITKSVFPGATDELVVTATFDNQKRVTRIDNYINNQLNQYDIQTWTEAKPASASLPLFKGFPVLNPTAPFSGKEGVLATRKYFYWNAVSKTIQQYTESTSTVQTNTQGYISNAVITVTYTAGSDQNSVTTETYTYSGCQ